MSDASLDPFESVEQALLTGIEVPRESVEALSGLEGEALARFHELWGRLDDEQREVLLNVTGEAAEENLVLDFSPVYRLAITDPDDAVRELALRLASEEADPALLDVYLRAAVADPDPDVRLAAVEELSAYTLTAQVDDWPAEVQAKIERALIGIIHLPDADTSIRTAALLALSYLTTPQTEVEIRQAHLQPDLRDAAIEAMGRNCQEIWIPDIRLELRDADPRRRVIAAQAAGELEDQALVPDLIDRIGDADEDVRLASVEALGVVGGATAKEALTDLLQSTNRALRDAARDAIQELIENEDPLSGFSPN